MTFAIAVSVLFVFVTAVVIAAARAAVVRHRRILMLKQRFRTTMSLRLLEKAIHLKRKASEEFPEIPIDIEDELVLANLLRQQLQAIAVNDFHLAVSLHKRICEWIEATNNHERSS